MTIFTTGRFFTFKICACALTFLMVVFYDYIPLRSLDLYPKNTEHLRVSVDSNTGGNSEFTWLDKSKTHWLCNLQHGVQYVFCGMYIVWSEPPHKKIDLSEYDGLQIELEYLGDAQYVRFFVRNFYPSLRAESDIKYAKFNSVIKPTSAFSQTINVEFSKLRVADWWINEYALSPEHINQEVDQTVAIGIDLPHLTPLGKHEFKLNSLKAVGVYFSKESMYLAIIVFWALLLLLESLNKNFNLSRKLEVDSQRFLEMKAKSAAYKEQAETDKLTGIFNREGLTGMVESLRTGHLLHQYSLMVIDLDHFKAVNDQHGHLVGDIVLQETVHVLKSCLRSFDILARWGGEEFVVLFYCMAPNDMESFAERLRKSVESTSFLEGKCNNVTISIGVTTISKSELFDNAFIRADKALYQAKENGRNQFVII